MYYALVNLGSFMNFKKLFSFLQSPAAAASAIFQNFPSIADNKAKFYSFLSKQRTPFFVIEQRLVTRRYQALTSALKNYWEPAAVAYSFKTNYALAGSKLLKQLGAWAEVVSGREYALARQVGYRGERIVFNGPLKTEAELGRAMAEAALIHVDNKPELLRLLSFKRSFLKKARVGLRINAPIAHLPPSRFGFGLSSGSAQAALSILGRARLRLTSLHLHLGTDIDAAEAYRSAAEQLAQFCNLAETKLAQRVSFLDLGGGFPGKGLPPFGKTSWQPALIEDYIRVIAQALKNNLSEPSGKTLLLEPGRHLIDDATVLLTKVYDVKRDNEVQKLLTDASVTMLPLRYYRPQIVQIYTPNLRQRSGRLVSTLIYGGSCREDDLLSGGYFPKASVGDLVIYYCVGAYNQSMGSDFIFGKPKTLFI